MGSFGRARRAPSALPLAGFGSYYAQYLHSTILSARPSRLLGRREEAVPLLGCRAPRGFHGARRQAEEVAERAGGRVGRRPTLDLGDALSVCVSAELNAEPQTHDRAAIRSADHISAGDTEPLVSVYHDSAAFILPFAFVL